MVREEMVLFLRIEKANMSTPQHKSEKYLVH